LNWPNVYVNMFYIYKNIFFVNKDTGLVVGLHTYPPSELGGCSITSDGGINWNSILGWPGTEFNSVYFVDDSNGWVVGSHGIIVRTSDSGMGWDRQLCPAIYNLNDVHFLNNELGWIVGEDGVILKTINGGEGWLVDNVGVTRDLNSVFFISSTDPSPGWIVGDNGLILSNTQGQVLDLHETENVVVKEFCLEQNYPNPFNPSTRIKFTVLSVGTRDRVSVQLKVYDVLGNEIATLVNEEKPAGTYEVEFNATGLPSGIYFYQLKAGEFTQTKKMTYLK
ncbi:MAG: YCF48-related protein, partial [Ignavibacteriaceae bacterium]|nr:YCF48-related protein [Ignavibacteriaceae bacterium]